MNNVTDRLLFLVDDLANGKATVFAKKSGIPPSTFQYYVKGRMPHGDHLKRICEFYCVNLNWLLSGKGGPYIKEEAEPSINDQPEPPAPNNVVEHHHMDLVRKFSDKPRGKSVVVDLLEIERLNRESFIEVAGFIKGVANNLKMGSDHQNYKDLERRKAQRRVADNNGDMPGGIERRSGKDRRKAVGGDR